MDGKSGVEVVALEILKGRALARYDFHACEVGISAGRWVFVLYCLLERVFIT